jgi:hypothetical protein
VFGLRLRYQISRVSRCVDFYELVPLGRHWIAARNLIPALSREFGLKRYILIVGLGDRAERGRALGDSLR